MKRWYLSSDGAHRPFIMMALILIISLLTSSCSIQGASPTSTLPAPMAPATNIPASTVTPIVDRASVVINPTQFLSGAIPTYFTGMSIEAGSLCQFLAVEQQNATLDRLYRNLSPLIVRVGGNSMESSSWSPNQPCSAVSFGKSTISALFAFAHRADAKIIWGLNLTANDPTTAADEAKYVSSIGGASLVGFEIGNEPNDWTTEAQYEQSWNAYVSAIKQAVPSASFVGPSMYDFEGTSWFNTYVQKEHNAISLVTYHFYPLRDNAPKGSPQDTTLSNLLSQSDMKRTAHDIARVVAVAHQYGLPLAIDESNSVNDGGVTGISDTAASALWMVDYLFTAAEQGAQAVNIHGGGGGTISPDYSPIKLALHGGKLIVQPDYYGMYFFHMATGDGATTPIATNVTSSADLAAHAVRDRNGTIVVALIDKDLHANVNVQVSFNGLSKNYRVTQVLRMSDSSLTATSGMTIGGNAIQSDGTWSKPQPSETAQWDGHRLTISVTRSSAVLVTLTAAK